MHLLEIIIASLAIMLASLSGVLFVWKGVGKFIAKNLHYLVSLSAGVFLVVALSLGGEVWAEAASPERGLLWVLVGAAGFWLAFALLPGFHHHHDDEREDEAHSHLDARRILAGDAIHNVGDGVLLASAFAVSPALGIATTVSVFLHELVQEVSEFFVLKQAGYSTRGALAMNFLVSAAILLGAVGSFFLLESFAGLEIPLLGITAGAFLVVVFQDLVPHSIREAETRAHYVKHLGWFAAGCILMFTVNTFALAHDHGEDGHERQEQHEHKNEHHDEHDEDTDEHTDDAAHDHSREQ